MNTFQPYTSRPETASHSPVDNAMTINTQIAQKSAKDSKQDSFVTTPTGDITPKVSDFIAVPTALGQRAHEYTRGPPSPPHISIPHVAIVKERILPAYAGVGGEQLGEEDLKNITQIHHVLTEKTSEWKYEHRRAAQLILPFLYLGPSAAAKDKEFLKREGITMLLAVRNIMSAQASLLSGKKVALELHIASATIDVAGNQELIAAFPAAIKIINDHLLSVYRTQTFLFPGASTGDVMINPQTFRRGKVLVFCESGNERSACAVIAYMIAMFGFDLEGAITFAMSQRFCVALDDDMTRLLKAFYDIVQAQRMVASAHKENHNPASEPSNQSWHRGKRGINETRDAEDGDILDMDIDMDMDRFEHRDGHQPFINHDGRL